MTSYLDRDVSNCLSNICNSQRMRANFYSLYDFTSFSKELQELQVKKLSGRKIQKQTSLNVEEMSSDSSTSSS